MSIISRLSVVLGLDTAEFNAGLGKAEQGVNKFGAMSGAMKASILAAGAAFVATARQAIVFADAINDVAKANEVSVSKVLEFSQALSVSGGKADDVSKIFANFTNKIDEAASGSQDMRDKFAKLGITLKDLQNLDMAQLFEKALKGLSQMPDTITRNALAFDTLGKGVKGVDIKGLNDEFQRINGTLESSDEKFAKIGDAIDNLDRLSTKIKTDMANNIAEPVSIAVGLLNSFYDTLKTGNGILEEAGKKLEKYGLTWKNIFFSNAMQTMEMGKIFAQIKNKDAAGGFSPMDQTQVTPSILKSDATTPKRIIEKTKEQIAAEEKLKKEIEGQSTALQQQINSIRLQTAELGGAASMAEKLKLEFDKGGKYHTQANTELAKQAMLVARAYDSQKDLVEAQKQAVQQAIYKNQLEMQDREARAQDAASQAIQKANFDYELSRQVESIELQKQRSKLEADIAGYSDTQRQKMLALFDLEREIIRLKERNYFISEEQVRAYRSASVALIEQEEITRRTANSFSAGWDRAYENFKERAMDSAQMGSRAFQNMTQSMETALDRFVKTGKLSFKELTASIIQDLISIQLRAQATGFFQSIFDNIGGLFGSAGGVPMNTPSFESYYNMPRFANGGTPPLNAPSLVGENGPELFVPRTSGTIVPNTQLSSMMMPPQQIIYNAPVIENMNAIDTQTGVQFLARNKDTIWSAYQSASRGMPMQRGG